MKNKPEIIKQIRTVDLIQNDVIVAVADNGQLTYIPVRSDPTQPPGPTGDVADGDFLAYVKGLV